MVVNVAGISHPHCPSFVMWVIFGMAAIAAVVTTPLIGWCIVVITFSSFRSANWHRLSSFSGMFLSIFIIVMVSGTAGDVCHVILSHIFCNHFLLPVHISMVGCVSMIHHFAFIHHLARLQFHDMLAE